MIFSKKTKLASLLNNSVDMHNHILPGIDDGASDIDTSIGLIKEYKALGYTQIIATPHTMSDYYPNTASTILEALDKLKEELIKQKIQNIDNNFNEVLYKLQLKNYQPILAHPERYSFYLNDFDKYYAIKKQGVKFQLNMLALTEHYGSKIQKTARRLLKEGMYDYIGIDTHRIEHLNKVSQIKISNKRLEKIKILLENNKSLF